MEKKINRRRKITAFSGKKRIDRRAKHFSEITLKIFFFLLFLKFKRIELGV